mgnify:CR=1 FL=1
MPNSNQYNKFIITDYIIRILRLIYENPGITISDISEQEKIPLSGVSTIIKQLKKHGLVDVVIEKVEKTTKRLNKEVAVKRVVRKVYPKSVTCSSGVLILPNIQKLNDNNGYAIGLTVITCPYYNICEYRNKATLVPGKCKLYDSLSEEDKIHISDIVSKLQTIIEYHKAFSSNNSNQ